MFDQCLYFNTSALARRLERRWAAAFQPFGLTVPQAFLLRAVLERPGCTAGELAELLVIARPTATRALDGLATLALIERQESERDGREVRIHATQAARALGAGLSAANAAVTRELKERVGEVDLGRTVSRVREVRSALE